jgi:hypothetical protein
MSNLANQKGNDFARDLLSQFSCTQMIHDMSKQHHPAVLGLLFPILISTLGEFVQTKKDRRDDFKGISTLNFPVNNLT